MGILTALSKEIRQGKRCLDRELAPSRQRTVPSRRHRALTNVILRCPGLVGCTPKGAYGNTAF